MGPRDAASDYQFLASAVETADAAALWAEQALEEQRRVEPVVRALCAERGVVYQGFSLLTANGRELASPAFSRIVDEVDATPAQIVFRFAQQVGMVPLTGTSSEAHMREDLACGDLALSDAQLRTIENLAS